MQPYIDDDLLGAVKAEEQPVAAEELRTAPMFVVASERSPLPVSVGRRIRWYLRQYALT